MRFTKNLQETKKYEISKMEDKKITPKFFNLGGVDMKSGVNISLCSSQERVLLFSYFSGAFFRIEFRFFCSLY